MINSKENQLAPTGQFKFYKVCRGSSLCIFQYDHLFLKFD